MADLAALPRTPTVERLDARLRGPGSVALVESSELDALVRETGLARDELILASVEWARRWARAPLSKFEVGAAALGSSGRLYLGANIEFAGLPLDQTVHAEQAVIVHAWVHAEPELVVVATSASPCGFCRQFMLELPEPRPRILSPGAEPTEISDLLPGAFGPELLGCEPSLLSAGPHGLVLAERDRERDPLLALALAAADRSSAPYTGSVAGAALVTAEGPRFAGGLVESVAYNPTLGPMQAALIALHLGGGLLERIVDAALVEREGAPSSQRESAARVLASVAPTVELRYALSRPGARTPSARGA